ncbi:unnamed protein product [Mesocestoides corti]|uniref:PDZ domain-containing protein n=1 Tax=Mesocestoides corti TaxID=53468 RepID=A0A0R3UQ25_MESCO|nr:unnamed protein product [Mesocestoides corti]
MDLASVRVSVQEVGGMYFSGLKSPESGAISRTHLVQVLEFQSTSRSAILMVRGTLGVGSVITGLAADPLTVPFLVSGTAFLPPALPSLARLTGRHNDRLCRCSDLHSRDLKVAGMGSPPQPDVRRLHTCAMMARSPRDLVLRFFTPAKIHVYILPPPVQCSKIDKIFISN